MTTGIIITRKLWLCRAVLLLIIVICAPVLKSCAQSAKSKLYMSAVIEKTILEKQAGGALFLQLPSLWRVGAFYQSTFDNKIEGSTNGTFWGGFVAMPLVKAGKMNFYASGRAGLVDNRFFVATPGLVTEIKISNRLSLDIGLSIRKGYVSATSNLNFRF